ncbi:hypothetical protein [Rhizobium sp. Leaf453]|uniref:hypothetical protein n=1 Tax=Rhizobium sp. Leaf453 TaxID=1736380 RepID=UPI0012E39D86|nr:hypothetical protein [Rhizobium sp. Leaf453]
MSYMPLDRGRNLLGREQVVIFRATGGESVWMNVIDAKETVARLPLEWSKEPFPGQSYGAPADGNKVEAARGGVAPIERPWGW